MEGDAHFALIRQAVSKCLSKRRYNERKKERAQSGSSSRGRGGPEDLRYNDDPQPQQGMPRWQTRQPGIWVYQTKKVVFLQCGLMSPISTPHRGSALGI